MNVIIPMQFVSFHRLDISSSTIYIFHTIETIISPQELYENITVQVLKL